MRRGCAAALAVALAACGAAPSKPTPTQATQATTTTQTAFVRPPDEHAAPPGDYVREVIERSELAVLRNGGFIQRTNSGNLVRFSAQLAHERDQPAHLTAIGTDGVGVFGAQPDGALVAIDPSSLAMTPAGSLGTRGTVTWLGVTDDQLVAAVAATEAVYYVALVPRHGGDTRWIEIPRLAPNQAPTTWLLDRDTLWYGADGGEWGGALGHVDLAHGTATIPMTDQASENGFLHDIDGFVRGPNGRIWFYGGMAHGVLPDAMIGSLDAHDVATLAWRSAPITGLDPRPTDWPIYGIVPRGDKLVIDSGPDVFTVSADLATWTPLAKLPPHARLSDDDAIRFPHVVQMVAGPADTILLATRFDGVLVLRGSSVTPLR